MNTYGFIGGGNMGGAMASAAIRAVGPERVLLCDKDPETTARLCAAIGATPATYEEVVANCRLIFLGVKPDLIAPVLTRLKPMLDQADHRVVLVSIAAGVTLSAMAQVIGADTPLIRMMQNTPVSLGAGMMVYTPSSAANGEDISALCEVMACAGRLDAIAEDKIDAATAVMGCGPAFAYQFVEALADGGVACGLTRGQAQLYAAQMLLGAAKMVLETGHHPGELKDAVCSPGGSTIEGVKALEQSGFRGATMGAVVASFERTKGLGKKG